MTNAHLVRNHPGRVLYVTGGIVPLNYRPSLHEAQRPSSRIDVTARVEKIL